MKVLVASKNPVKIKAVRKGFRLVFGMRGMRVEGTESNSKVGDQPMSDRITKRGAYNRVMDIKSRFPEMDYWVSLEGGVEKNKYQLDSFAWVAIADTKRLYFSRTATFALPSAVKKRLNQKTELGQIMDELHHKHNSKQNQGAVGILTEGQIDRTALYIQAVRLALIPFLREREYLLLDEQ